MWGHGTQKAAGRLSEGGVGTEEHATADVAPFECLLMGEIETKRHHLCGLQFR
jgi:hypothetical protein